MDKPGRHFDRMIQARLATVIGKSTLRVLERETRLRVDTLCQIWISITGLVIESN